ncbi:hypothetical protein HRE53_10310 [Acaryochloris sp. 'Moss Beach']|uniref:hypothetical protein n=1 Tax=Acaryochloris TaxID=155977 RepID=UPI001BAFD39C|nr:MULTISPECIES: hypothetical protein [Acaryochloris]QUY42235.1 hypothetical protein I1H34_24020 [Acaryochloris marina S15]UJB71345.1 hypothetical protein HRE53_10310 [Acaryochloris sp. 'Moss Beach']
MNAVAIFIALLKDRQTFLQEIHEGKRLSVKISALLICSFCSFATYGAIVGSFHSPLQALSSGLKLPTLYLITLLVCLPALYVFNALFGSRQTIAQHFTYVLSAAAVIALLLVGFAPITLFFVITISPVQDYSFYLLLNVVVFALTGMFGVSFLYQAMRPVAQSDTDTNVQLRSTVLRFWLCLYGFVGSQLGWTLRPFFGSPGAFELFRSREGNFWTGVLDAIANLMQGAG